MTRQGFAARNEGGTDNTMTHHKHESHGHVRDENQRDSRRIPQRLASVAGSRMMLLAMAMYVLTLDDSSGPSIIRQGMW